MLFKRGSFLLVVAFLFSVSGTVGSTASSTPTVPEWVIDNPYRLTVTVTPVGDRKRHQTPVGVEVNFAKLLQEKTSSRLDRNSIRVVRYDPRTGQSLPYKESSLAYDIPYQLSRDFFYGDAGKIWWRLRDEDDRYFHIYFSTLEKGAKAQPEYIPAIGNGDNLRLNNGRPGVLDIAMHPSINYVDWDSDGIKDLLIGSGQTHEYGLERISQGYLYFFKNIGTPQKPLFAPGFQLRDGSGKYLNNDGFFHFYYTLADWDKDGDLDIVHSSFGENFYWYENTGRRARNNLPILLGHKEPVFQLGKGNDFSTDYYRRHPRLLDWDGDGDLDLFYSLHSEHINTNVSAGDVVVPWDEVLQFFEVHENLGNDAKGRVQWASAKAVRTARGPIIATMGYQGAEYADWDGDGDLDMIAGDTNNHPMGSPRVLWFENVGTRSKPLFLTDQTLLTSVEEFATDPGTRALDWDADGDLDLFLVGLEGFIKICENTGADSRGVPQLADCKFIEQTAPLVTGAHHAKFRVVDWNGDGLNDLIEGSENGKVKWLENVGTVVDPIFKPAVPLRAAEKEIRMINGLDSPQGPTERNAGYVAPAAIDFDGDGDLDLFVGDMRGYQTYFENVGTAKNPQLTAGRFVTVQGQLRSFGWRNQLGLGDIDADREIEIVSTAYTDRRVHIYKVSKNQDKAGELKVDQIAPLRLDTGAPLIPYLTIANNNGDYIHNLADWDNDGDLDLFIGSLYNVWYYENVGSRRSPVFVSRDKVMVEGKPLHVSNHAGNVEIVDWNRDGMKDLLIGGESGWCYFFERSFLEGALPTVRTSGVESRS